MFDSILFMLCQIEAAPFLPFGPYGPTYKDSMTYLGCLAIILMALFPIYIGSYLSLHNAISSRNKEERETLSATDAWMFPLIGSAGLFTLYLLFKVFQLTEYVNLLLTSYFMLFGIVALATSISPFLESFFPSSLTTPFTTQFNFPNIPLLSYFISPGEKQISISFTDVVSYIIASLVAVWYTLTKHWIANNLLGIAFSIKGVSLITLGSFKVGMILLGGLFLYDIFWVFATEVMVTVAKSFDAPVKLLFPHDLFHHTNQKNEFSMLGLGDIVMPGVFIALCLRFDFNRAFSRGSYPKTLGDLARKKWRRPYFQTNFVFYVLGMLTTLFVMHFFKAAQPALLYLVPACIGGALLTASRLNETKRMFLFDEENAIYDTSKKGKRRRNKAKK
eukprot:TRINITY_DN2364_c0_g1_i1.p1 TRINITY_DN2364_c0_g1~~TRINITY_DN2364_c0_g1_i1.p1  ORF type:complete len:390 (-),score=68.46 TRINITY_DN2364_c0_g1_i1:25-1194(-)